MQNSALRNINFVPDPLGSAEANDSGNPLSEMTGCCFLKQLKHPISMLLDRVITDNMISDVTTIESRQFSAWTRKPVWIAPWPLQRLEEDAVFGFAGETCVDVGNGRRLQHQSRKRKPGAHPQARPKKKQGSVRTIFCEAVAFGMKGPHGRPWGTRYPQRK